MPDLVESGDGRGTSDAAGLLTQLFGTGADDFGALTTAAEPPLHWPSVAAEQVDGEWRALFSWVTQLQQRFPEMVRLPICWYRHNGLVETLAALRDHERASYAPASVPTAAVAWHVAFRDIEGRLRTWIADLRCGGDPRWHDEIDGPAQPTRSDLPAEFTAWIGNDRRRRDRVSAG